METAVNVGIFLFVGFTDGFQNRPRFLSRRTIVHIDQRLVVNGARQYGKIRPNACNIVVRRSPFRDVLLRFFVAGIHSGPSFRQPVACLPQDELAHLVLAQLLNSLTNECSNQKGFGFAFTDTPGSEIEQKILIDLPRCRPVAAGNVIGENLQFWLGIKLSLISQQQAWAICLPSVF